MELIRSESPEVARSIASTGALACWGWSTPTLACVASVPGLLLALAIGFIISVHAAVWTGVPVVLASNAYLLWRGRSPRLNWVLAGCGDRVYLRLFVRRGRGRHIANEPDVMMLEALEITSMSARSIEVFLYGPKPKVVERLVIELDREAAKAVSRYARPLLRPEGKQVFVVNEHGRLTVEWKWCRPDLRTFLQQITRECPSIAIGPEEQSELDLNGIWHGLRENPNAEQRRMLAQACRFGFGCKCQSLLRIYRRMSPREAREYLTEVEQEDAGVQAR